MSNFILSLSVQDKTVSLSIKNEMRQNCYISESSIMLDGFKNDKFQITHQSGEHAVYQGATVKYYPKLVLLKKDEFLSNEIDLSNAYLFPKSGEYSIDYYTHVSCCQDIEGKDCSSSGMIGASTNTYMSYRQYGSLTSKYLCSPEKLVAFVTSKTFKMLSYEHQTDLVGEKLLLKMQDCLLTEEQDQYNLECLGQAMLDI